MLKLEQLFLKLNFDGKKTTKILFRKLEDSSLVHFFDNIFPNRTDQPKSDVMSLKTRGYKTYTSQTAVCSEEPVHILQNQLRSLVPARNTRI